MEAVEDKSLEIEARKYLDIDLGNFDYPTLMAWAARIYKIGFKRGAKTKRVQEYSKENMSIEDLFNWAKDHNCEDYRISVYDGRSRFSLTEEHLGIDQDDKAVRI